MSEELAIREEEQISLGALRADNPAALLEAASRIATPLAKMIADRGLANSIGGRKYVRCEGWTTMGAMLGVVPREVSNAAEGPHDVYVAIVELVNVKTGAVVGRASAECGAPDELDRNGRPLWASRPAYARRSMAATRATSKAFRLSFSWIMTLAGYEATPAEEMEPILEERSGTERKVDTGGKVKPRVDPPTWRGKLVKHEQRSGQKANGEPWTLDTFTGADGTKFGTFSSTVAAGLLRLDGHFVEIVFSASAKGNATIEEFRDVSLEEVPL